MSDKKDAAPDGEPPDLRSFMVSDDPFDDARTVATVLLHRWAEHAFSLSRRWRDLRAEELTGFVREEMLSLRTTPRGPLTLGASAILLATHDLKGPSSRTIEEVVRWAVGLDLRTSDGRQTASEVLEFFLERTTDRAYSDAPVPAPVTKLFVELAQPRPGERILVPCLGSGDLLMATVSKLRAQDPPVAKGRSQLQHLCTEIPRRTSAALVIGAARGILAAGEDLGVASPGIHGQTRENAATRDASETNGYPQPKWDCVLCIPNRWGSRGPQGTAFEMETLQHVMASLRAGGRAVVALPERTLFRVVDWQVRRELLSDFRVEGVVSLPAEAFQPFSRIKRSLVLFRREKPAQAVRFLRVEEWPPIRFFASSSRVAFKWPPTRSGDAWTREQALETAHTIAGAFRKGPSDDGAWEVPVAKLAERGWELVAKRTGEQALRRSLSALAEANEEFVVRPLEDVAEILPGVWDRGRAITSLREDHSVVAGILRAADIGRWRLRHPSRFLTEDGSVRVPEHLLKAGDILLSVSGMIGKTGIVRESSGNGPLGIGTVAARDVVVIRPGPRLSPPFLKCLLAARDYQDWLHGHARGQAFQRLSIKALKGLPVPVPELASQERLVRHMIGQEGDALSTFTRVLSERAWDAIDAWLHGSAAREPNVAGDATHRWMVVRERGAAAYRVGDPHLARDATDRLMLLEEKANSLQALKSEVVRGRIEVAIRNKWLLALADSMRTLQGLSQVPAGQERLAVLDGAQARIDRVLADLERSSSPNAGRARKATRRISRIVREERESISVGHEAALPDDLGTSPYIVGSPVRRTEMFFGRREMIDEIRRQFQSDDPANIVLLEGSRRTGKTSILERLRAPDMLPEWITVYCSLRGGWGHPTKPGLPTNEVFRLMARDIGLAAHSAGINVWLPDTAPPDPKMPFRLAFATTVRKAFSGSRPFETFELFLRTVIDAARPRRILLMLDDFHRLHEGIDNEVTSPHVPENIRCLLHTHPEFSAILVDSRRIKRSRAERPHALLAFDHRLSVSALALEDARLLVTQPVERRLSYAPEARDRVVDLCARRPFLIQSLCHRIFDAVRSDRENAERSDRRTVTVRDVETAAAAMTEDNDHFHSLWEYARTEHRRILLVLCRVLGPDPVTLSLLDAKLEEHGFPLTLQRLEDELEHLRDLALIELRSTAHGSGYALAVPLMADWIDRNVSIDGQQRLSVREY